MNLSNRTDLYVREKSIHSIILLTNTESDSINRVIYNYVLIKIQCIMNKFSTAQPRHCDTRPKEAKWEEAIPTDHRI